MRYVTTTIDDNCFTKLDKKATEEGRSRAELMRRILTRYFDAYENNNKNQMAEHLKLIREAMTINEIAKETRDEKNDNQPPISEQTKGKFVW